MIRYAPRRSFLCGLTVAGLSVWIAGQSPAQTTDSFAPEVVKTNAGYLIVVSPRLIGVYYREGDTNPLPYFRGDTGYDYIRQSDFDSFRQRHSNYWVTGQTTIAYKTVRCVVYLPNVDLIEWRGNGVTLRYIMIREPVPKILDVVVADAAEVRKVHDFVHQ